MWEKEFYVASELSKRRRERALTQAQLATSLGPKMRLSSGTVGTLISEYENGYFKRASYHPRVHLTRLALYVRELHLEDEILGRVNATLKEIDTRYEYPPDETKLIRIKMTRLAG